MKKILSACFVLLLFAACKKDGLQLTETEPVDNKAFLRVYYYSPNPNVNNLLKLNGTKVGSTFFYSQLNPTDAASYLAVDAGRGVGQFVVPKAGTTTDSAVLTSFNYDFQQGSYQSILVIDTLSGVRTLLLQDTLTPPAPGKARVRFINTMYNVPSADVGIAGGARLVAGLAYGTASSYVELDANQTYNLRFYNPNTTTQLTGTSASTFLTNLTTGDQRIYTIVLRGVGGSTATAPVLTVLTNR